MIVLLYAVPEVTSASGDLRARVAAGHIRYDLEHTDVGRRRICGGVLGQLRVRRQQRAAGRGVRVEVGVDTVDRQNRLVLRQFHDTRVDLLAGDHREPGLVAVPQVGDVVLGCEQVTAGGVAVGLWSSRGRPRPAVAEKNRKGPGCWPANRCRSGSRRCPSSVPSWMKKSSPPPLGRPIP